MGGFLALKPGEEKVVKLRMRGPRTRKEGKAFREALAALVRKYQTRIVATPMPRKASKGKGMSKKRSRER
jgi:hypothetical protein